MQSESDSPSPQPLTFGGVAAFAHAPKGRLLLFQTAVALLAAAAVVLVFELGWVPVIQRTIAALPASGEIRNAMLEWHGAPPVRSTGSSFLWVTVDPAETLEPGEGADLQIHFGATEIRFRALLGYWAAPYPSRFRIALNRTELEPWWGAWHPAVAAGLAVGTMLWLFATWFLLALIYAWPVRLISFYADRQLTWLGAWRLAAACLLPGALFFTIAFAGYAWQEINLVQLLTAAALHLMIGWVYLLFSPFSLPRKSLPPPSARKNPFQAGKTKPRRNPFAGSR